MKSSIPTEPIGSIPRSKTLIAAYKKYQKGELDFLTLNELAEKETLQVVRELEALGCPVISDGEQRKFDGFAHYCLHNSKSYSKEGLEVSFSDGHKRVFAPHLKVPPFKYEQTADVFLKFALQHAHVPVKQAVISPSMLSLVYPAKGIESYNHEQFINDLIEQHVAEVRRCLDLGAHKVQIDFTEARLSIKYDPSGDMLNSFVELINKCLAHFNDEEIQKIGIHTCPGADVDCTHSAEVDYKHLLPTLFKINAGNFYVAMRSEQNPRKALRLIGHVIRPFQRVFIGVTDPNNKTPETPEEVCELILQAAEFIPLEQLGTTDDCGFSPFLDDASTNRELVYQKISARLEGTRLAEKILFSGSSHR
ncbi:5-methyltetrahydropteroyltriglutamate--homocysteine methyltransferase [Psychromonas sp. MB-3u-54]|uniref:5-methyltetrahydropteroyltriglutamate-- homocysteine methyltransferase n=1 Tax=Psychromonas sp. MB-3u-54 TaxID=2058319 RepID=UPI000C34F1AA|nr:5-methyltetrahydropteroyltriglutamate--homocysteine methyltransferase [Psychromonas sp. MB-3u-54]PKH03050.1 5-methyltetrahydropteroyltriglutamate--homocysteine methyltransferase [Psychromonas sp. MB-3u-54]